MVRENYWWLNFEQCLATSKNGKRCQNSVRRPFEIRPGDLYIYATCAVHADQEREIKVAQGLGAVYDRAFKTP